MNLSRNAFEYIAITAAVGSWGLAVVFTSPGKGNWIATGVILAVTVACLLLIAISRVEGNIACKKGVFVFCISTFLSWVLIRHSFYLQ